jgi:flagellar motor switch protein FliN/FliY
MHQTNLTDNRTSQENLSHLTRVPLEVTVELGRSELPIQEILGLGAGSLITLDSLVGEPVDLLVNGHFFAKGEVIAVEEETYGLRITNIISEEERLNRLAEMV